MKDAIVTTLRMPREIHERIFQVSEARTETVSSFIRRAILKELASLSYLDDDLKKALGIFILEEMDD